MLFLLMWLSCDGTTPAGAELMRLFSTRMAGAAVSGLLFAPPRKMRKADQPEFFDPGVTRFSFFFLAAAMLRASRPGITSTGS
jgi:hypothetical protein